MDDRLQTDLATASRGSTPPDSGRDVPPAPTCETPSTQWRLSGERLVRRPHRTEIAEETAVALTYNGASHAVMMATPQDLEDFAVGFSLTEGVIESIADIDELETCAVADGVELRMWLTRDRAARLARRRRQTLGATGCGLCGVESLAQAMRPVAPVAGRFAVRPSDVAAAMRALGPLQSLHRRTHATHAAAFWSPGRGVVCLREDVGRHNALDKLVGALARQAIDARSGIVALTSRLSVEMVQKLCACGAPIVASVSAPTGLALRVAEAAGVAVAAIVRDDGFEVFTHPERLNEPEFEGAPNDLGARSVA